MGTVYVADSINHRIMRWFKGSKSGNVIIGGRGIGSGTDQLAYPEDLQFDRQGNLYVVDLNDNRIQMFTIDKSSCVKGTCETLLLFERSTFLYQSSSCRFDLE
ncbi:unnamed protein product [Rotaria socialis]|uniref:Uncharacterized protein n=1 Tax=Rotaria socialis TaxID=392032 RepID=A0A821G2L7_9BILA|nr:unnamed protein product [Rotaria socialis]